MSNILLMIILVGVLIFSTNARHISHFQDINDHKQLTGTQPKTI